MMPRHHTLFLIFCTPLIGLIVLTAPSPANSSTDSSCIPHAFFIEGVETSARADDAEEARNMAMSLALKQAWSRLAHRVLVDPAAGLKIPILDDNASLRNLVDYVRVDSETVLPKRYRATLTYCFDRTRTRRYFDEQGLAHAELASGPMLVLPIWAAGQNPHLWRRPNPWGDAWGAVMRERDGLVALMPPLNLATERALRAEDLVAFDPMAIAMAGRLEGAEGVIVTVLTPQADDGDGEVITASVHATLFNRDGSKESAFFRRHDVAFNRQDMAASLRHLAGEIGAGIETVWRDVNRISFGTYGGFTLRVEATSMRSWSEQLELLSRLAPVEELRVIQLDSSGGQVRLVLSSSMQSLAYALEAEGLALESRDAIDGGQDGGRGFVLVARDR